MQSYLPEKFRGDGDEGIMLTYTAVVLVPGVGASLAPRSQQELKTLATAMDMIIDG